MSMSRHWETQHMPLNKPTLPLLKHAGRAAARVNKHPNHIYGAGGSRHELDADLNK